MDTEKHMEEKKERDDDNWKRLLIIQNGSRVYGTHKPFKSDP